MTHWAAQYIGTPHARGATGPDAFDCWQFFRHVQQERFNVHVADVAMPVTLADTVRALQHEEERSNWDRVETPAEGDAVLMSRSSSAAARGLAVHIGIWIHANNTAGVLHCAERAGVLFSTPAALRLQGWGGVAYYRHKGPRQCTP